MMVMVMEADKISFSLNLPVDRISDCVLNTARVVDGCLLQLLFAARKERREARRIVLLLKQEDD
jgi:hypothetical protein